MPNSRNRHRRSKPPATQPAVSAAAPAAALGLVLDRPENSDAVEALIADREPLFTTSGVTYTIPKKVPPSWSLQAFDIAISRGESAALTFACSKLLTVEAWDALQSCPTLTSDDLTVVLQAVMDRMLPEGSPVPKGR